MFRNNNFFQRENNVSTSQNAMNNQQTILITFLNQIKTSLRNQEENYLNLLSENRRMISEIDNYIHEYERNNISSHNFLTDEDILRYTTAHRYDEIDNPMNNYCHISGLTFRSYDWVCKLPCGHLFNGPSICYHLSRINSQCPNCNRNVVDEYHIQNNINENQTYNFTQQTQTNTPQRVRRTTRRTRTNVEPLLLFDNSLTNEFTALLTSMLASSFDYTNILTEREISNAIETIRYGDIEEPLSERCPISYIEFTPDMNVSRIKHCQHIFDINSLSEWLTRKNTCPVCRHDLNSNSSTNMDSSRNTINRNNTNENINSQQDVSGNYYTNNGYTSYYYISRRL
jgi:hypothetical protein